MKILVIEDEKTLRENITRYLQGEQYHCEIAVDYGSALEKLDLFDYDCILLDISLPGGSGLELLKIFRKNKKQDGLIIISARDSIDDKIKGLNLGADDYLAKPFHLAELEARIASVIRRKYSAVGNKMSFGDLSVDLQAKTVEIDTEILDLTPTEYDLLLFLMVNKNRVVSKNAIAVHLLGDDAEWLMQYDIIYAHIKNLRKKLSETGSPVYIRSRYGVGYKIELR
ncbi:MAG TPA: response regulator transcription factor [Edaphocola sp.]|nr:response regulator transcription factor [Edaphocola sp.]